MKRLIVSLLLVVNISLCKPHTANTTGNAHQQHANQNKPKPDNSAKVVLKNFLQVIISFFNILQNPQDPQTVATNVGSMAMHMATIAQEATRLGLLRENYTPEEFAAFIENLDDETKQEIANAIVNRLSTIQNKILDEQLER